MNQQRSSRDFLTTCPTDVLWPDHILSQMYMLPYWTQHFALPITPTEIQQGAKEAKSLWFQREWGVLKVSTWESLNLERPSFSASIFHLKVFVMQYLGMVLPSHLGHAAVRSLVQSLLEVHGSLPKNGDGQFLSLSISKGSITNVTS